MILGAICGRLKSEIFWLVRHHVWRMLDVEGKYFDSFCRVEY
jgi:hypothetical protein